MTKDEMEYSIYTDFFRIQGKDFSFKDKIKVWLNYNTLAGFRVLYFYRHCIRFRDGNKIIYRIWEYLYKRVCEHYSVEIPIGVTIGNGCIFYHANGIVLHPNSVIGNNCAVLQQVTIGNSGKSRTQVAVLGDGVTVGAGARLIGPIVIGDYVSIGANAVVTHDIPGECTAAGIPARILNENKPNSPHNTDYLNFDEWKARRNK